MDPTQHFPPSYLVEYRGQELVRVVVALAVIDTFFVFLFFISRFLNKTANGWDVYLMVPGYLCYLGNIIVMICKPQPISSESWVAKAFVKGIEANGPPTVLIQYGGIGHHIVALQPSVLTRFFKLIVAVEFLYCLAMMFPKLVILCFYGRIFTTTPYRYSNYAIGMVVILTCVASILVAILICRPLHYNWELKLPHNHCGDIAAFYVWISVPNLITDLAMIILPLVSVWRLQINTRNKLDLSFTFLTGCVGFVAGIIRFALFVHSNIYIDATYQATKWSSWTIVEPGVYLIASTLPSLRPLIRKTFDGINSTTLYQMLRGVHLRRKTPSKQSGDSSLRTQSDPMSSAKAVDHDGKAEPAPFLELNETSFHRSRRSDEDTESGLF